MKWMSLDLDILKAMIVKDSSLPWKNTKYIQGFKKMKGVFASTYLTS